MASPVMSILSLLLVSLELVSGALLNIRPYRGTILNMHNNFRGVEPASNMRRMTWDYYLERRAARWSETCYFEHQRRGLGENLSYFASTGRPVSATTVVRRSIQMWAAEKRLWRWSTRCGAACHYTQLIWATTSRVGCALSYCPYMRQGSGPPQRNSMYFVCFYSPAGNYIGQFPFIPGRKCSRCDRGSYCNRGLCAGGRRFFGRRRRRSLRLSAQDEFLDAIYQPAIQK